MDSDFQLIVPVFIPDVDAVRAFAQQLHTRNEDWQGEVYGWEAEYRASRTAPPPHSKMSFTPAEFWLGDSTVWGFSMMWEDGDDHLPAETLNDWNVIEELQTI